VRGFVGAKGGAGVIRVFPRWTSGTPTDALAYVGEPDLFAEADRIEISVTFSWDRAEAERLARLWERIAPVEIGGPAIDAQPGPFVAGKYLRHGYTITSRGCPNRCWFCQAWQKETFIELPIVPGHIVQDNNLLACSEAHVRAVFSMLARQRQPAVFAGGFEARRLKDWHVDLLANLRPRPSVFFSYDQPRADDWNALVAAVRKLWSAGFTPQSHRVRCYVLIGFPGDRLWAAEQRLESVLELGMTPSAMLYRDATEDLPDLDWRRLQRNWMRWPSFTPGRS